MNSVSTVAQLHIVTEKLNSNVVFLFDIISFLKKKLKKTQENYFFNSTNFVQIVQKTKTTQGSARLHKSSLESAINSIKLYLQSFLQFTV